MAYVLDTNVVIAALNGGERVLSRLLLIAVDDTILPIVVIPELLYGAQRSLQRAPTLLAYLHSVTAFEWPQSTKV